MTAVFHALFCAVALVSLGDLRLATWQAMGVMLLWGLGLLVAPLPRRGLFALVLCGALVRVVLLASPVSLSDDLFRYLWEGRLVSLGGNPFLTSPAEALAGGASDPFLSQVNHPEIATIYPPLALWLFSAVARLWYAPMAMKILMGLADVGVVWALGSILRGRRRSLNGAWLYALHPLAAVESAGSGHLEPVAILCMLLGLLAWDQRRSGLGWVGIGVLVKLFPIVLVPALWRRSPWLLVVVACLAIVAGMPFVDAGPSLFEGLGAYAGRWAFNGSVFPVLEWALGGFARPVAIALGAGVVFVAIRRFRDPARVAMWAGAAFVLLSPTVHPWYIAWAWIPALICGVRGWTVLATLAPVSYAALASYDPSSSSWSEPWWPVWVQYLPFLGVLLWESARHWTQPGPWAPGRPAPASPSRYRI